MERRESVCVSRGEPKLDGQPFVVRARAATPGNRAAAGSRARAREARKAGSSRLYEGEECPFGGAHLPGVSTDFASWGEHQGTEETRPGRSRRRVGPVVAKL